MSKLSSTSPSVGLAPTRERAAKAEIFSPKESYRRPLEVLDPITKYAPHLADGTADRVRDYAQTRIEVETASWALNSYTARVDHGGWENGGGLDSLSTGFEDQVKWLERLHRGFTPQMYAVANVLTEAVADPRKPCPFEMQAVSIRLVL